MGTNSVMAIDRPRRFYHNVAVFVISVVVVVVVLVVLVVVVIVIVIMLLNIQAFVVIGIVFIDKVVQDASRRWKKKILSLSKYCLRLSSYLLYRVVEILRRYCLQHCE